jgi:hypothetical protein
VSEWKVNSILAADRDIADINLSFGNMVNDVATLTMNRNYDASIPGDLAYGQTVVITLDGVTVFRGTSQGPVHSGSAREELVSIEVIGAWNELEIVAATGTVNDILGGSYKSGNFVLSGALPTVVTNVINMAISDGARLTLGTIDLDTISIPEMTVSSSTYAGCLMQLLRWSPGAQVVFDYSYSSPRINVLRLGSSSLLDVGTTGAIALNYHERQDLVPVGVKLIYERQVNSEMFLNVAHLPGGDGLEPTHTITSGKTLVATDTAGSASGRNVLVCTINLSGTINKEVRNFWFGHEEIPGGPSMAWLLSKNSEGIYSRVGEVLLRCGESVVESAYSSYTPFEIYDYCRELSWSATKLTSGTTETAPNLSALYQVITTSPWAVGFPDSNFYAVPGFSMWEVSITTKWYTAKTLPGTPKTNTCRALFASVNGGPIVETTISALKNSTTDVLEPTPAGLAGKVMSVNSTVFVEGSLSKEFTNISPMQRMVSVGGRSAPVQSISFSAGSMLMNMSFGPPTQLQPQDLLALMKVVAK